MTSENKPIILQKNSLVFNMWDDRDFEELVDRSTNTYLSKILTTPIPRQQQPIIPRQQQPVNPRQQQPIIPRQQQPVNPRNRLGIKYRRYLASRKPPINNLLKSLSVNIYNRK